MSFLQALFGGTFESNRKEGEEAFAAKRYGEAKIAFDRALARGKGVSQADIDLVKDRVRVCRQSLAEARIAAADERAALREFDEARDLLKDATDICDEEEIAAAIRERIKRYEATDARRLVEESGEIDDEELLTVIAGTWSDDQADEFAAMPDALREALLAAHDKQHERAVELLEQVIAAKDLPVDPCYVYLELGRELILIKNGAAAAEALARFLELTEDDEEAREARVTALTLKAQALVLGERFDEAKEELRRATSESPADHNVFLNLGVFLRSRGEHDAAIAALLRAAELMGQLQPDFRVIRELGFTYLAAGKKQEAAASLGAVIEHLASRGEHDQFDPETAVALARLHEEAGEHGKAADLFRHLALGYDTQNHFLYNLEAARLLSRAGAEADLVERYLTRATELAPDPEQIARVAAVRAGKST